MTQRTNQEIERYYLNKALVFLQKPDGELVHGDKPDVVIRGARKIGIDLTNFYLRSGRDPLSEQRQHKTRDKIVREARELYCAGGGGNIGLTVTFDPRNPVTPDRRRTLPKQLAALAHRLENRGSGEIEWRMFPSMPEIDSFWLHATEGVNQGWRLQTRGSPELMNRGELEAIVREKEAQATAYETCDESWLLVIVDPNDPAQEQETRIDDAFVASDVFARIILYHTYGHIVDARRTPV